MLLYNTHSQHLERLPIDRSLITIYVCSPPRQDTLRLSHIFTYTMADCLIRYLEFLGHRIRYFYQATDSDAPPLSQALAMQEDWHFLGEVGTAHFIAALQTLNVRPPDACFANHEREHTQLKALNRGVTHTCFCFHSAMTEAEDEARTHSSPNQVIVTDLLTQYSADVLRFYLASHHYRRPWIFSQERLERAVDQMHTITRAATVRGGHRRHYNPITLSQHVLAALNDDLNTPSALTALLYLADEMMVAAAAGWQVKQAQATLLALSRIFGLRLGKPPEPRVIKGWRHHLPVLATHRTNAQTEPPSA
jgi:cysteinyl-tRNA synthetase